MKAISILDLAKSDLIQIIKTSAINSAEAVHSFEDDHLPCHDVVITFERGMSATNQKPVLKLETACAFYWQDMEDFGMYSHDEIEDVILDYIEANYEALQELEEMEIADKELRALEKAQQEQ